MKSSISLYRRTETADQSEKLWPENCTDEQKRQQSERMKEYWRTHEFPEGTAQAHKRKKESLLGVTVRPLRNTGRCCVSG